MRSRPPTASGQLQAGLLARILVGGLFLQPFLLFAQRAVDVENPEGKWEVLEGCRLVPNSPVDGDSFRILHKGREYGVRLYFVDAPETESVLEERALDQATYFGIAIKDVPRAGQLAARFTREKLSGREFIVQTRWQNGMGRGNVAPFLL
jgi:endonuclease YncB( thermonuclease family)